MGATAAGRASERPDAAPPSDEGMKATEALAALVVLPASPDAPAAS
jgi:hypothetical protein